MLSNEVITTDGDDNKVNNEQVTSFGSFHDSKKNKRFIN